MIRGDSGDSCSSFGQLRLNLPNLREETIRMANPKKTSLCRRSGALPAGEFAPQVLDGGDGMVAEHPRARPAHH